MWSPNHEKLKNALKSHKKKSREVMARLHAVEEELDRCRIEEYEALVNGQDWHDDPGSAGLESTKIHTHSGSAQPSESSGSSHSPLAPDRSLASSKVFSPNAALRRSRLTKQSATEEIPLQDLSRP